MSMICRRLRIIVGSVAIISFLVSITTATDQPKEQTGTTPRQDEAVQTDWELIRSVMNGVIDACAAMEKLHPDLYKGEYEARSAYQPDVCVGDFLNRFWQYPEGSQRDIIRIRSMLGHDQKHPNELARALVAAAMACAEAVGVSQEELAKEMSQLKPHCDSAGKSIKSQLNGIPKIQKGWMFTGVTKAIEDYRKKEQK